MKKPPTPKQMKQYWSLVEQKIIDSENFQRLLQDPNRPARHIINCNADPFVPEGMTVREHRMGGELEWDPARIDLYLSDEQTIYGFVNGLDFNDEYPRFVPLLNANVLDYLIAHPDLIPHSWKRKCVFFWNTLYDDASGRACVRYIRWNGCEMRDGHPHHSFHHGHLLLICNFDDESPAAISA